MKLASRYSRANLFTSLVILLLSGIAYYFIIRYILTSNLDKDLVVEEQEILEYVGRYKRLPLPGNFKDQIVQYAFSQKPVTRLFSDTEYNNIKEHEKEPGRMLITSVSLNNKIIRVEIIKSRVESEDLIRIIFLITLIITVLLLMALALINRFVLKRIYGSHFITYYHSCKTLG